MLHKSYLFNLSKLYEYRYKMPKIPFFRSELFHKKSNSVYTIIWNYFTSTFPNNVFNL